MTDDLANPSCPIKLAHGTTTLAFRFQGGIVRFIPIGLAILWYLWFIGTDSFGWNLDCVHRLASNSRKLDRQSDSEEGYSRVAVEPWRGQAD